MFRIIIFADGILWLKPPEIPTKYSANADKQVKQTKKCRQSPLPSANCSIMKPNTFALTPNF
ncbi:hypothetical protein CGZ60_08400 [Neisseria animalis]|nr:hypothetical protein CGZ60_08400 [Neisseria animalis]